MLARERVAAGTRITLKEFDTTSLIICTSDLSTYDRLRLLVEGIRPRAVSLAIEQSEILLQAVTETNGRLAADGHQFRSKVDLKRRRQAGIEAHPRTFPISSPNRRKQSTPPAKQWNGRTTPKPGPRHVVPNARSAS